MATAKTTTRRRIRKASDVEENFRLSLPEARADRGLSQAQLAKEMTIFGYPTNTTVIARIESGERKVTLEEAFVITAALGCQLTHLIAPPTVEKVRITKKLSVPASKFREWMRGITPLHVDDVRTFKTGRLVNEKDYNDFVSAGPSGGFGPSRPQEDDTPQQSRKQSKSAAPSSKEAKTSAR